MKEGKPMDNRPIRTSAKALVIRDERPCPGYLGNEEIGDPAAD